MSATKVTDPISPDLKQVLRTLKLGKLLDTLPERLTLARQQHLPHADFLELVLADEVTRRKTNSARLRARTTGLDPSMHINTWNPTAAVRYDQQLWAKLTSLRFLDGPHGALLLGPVGVGKTHLATTLGHIAVRRRHSVLMARADKLLKRLKPARLDNSVRPRCAGWPTSSCSSSTTSPSNRYTTETTDFYELIVKRHRKAATVLTSNRTPNE